MGGETSRSSSGWQQAGRAAPQPLPEPRSAPFPTEKQHLSQLLHSCLAQSHSWCSCGCFWSDGFLHLFSSDSAWPRASPGALVLGVMVWGSACSPPNIRAGKILNSLFPHPWNSAVQILGLGHAGRTRPFLGHGAYLMLSFQIISLCSFAVGRWIQPRTEW